MALQEAGIRPTVFRIDWDSPVASVPRVSAGT
jgi:hypothetical protein